MTGGLKDVHRKAIVAVIAANIRVERAVLFGSRATGTNTVSSDVDIALFGNQLTLTDQARLVAALDEIPMAQSVDLILYDSIRSRTLQEHIRDHGIEWYARPTRDERDSFSPSRGCPGDWVSINLGRVCTKIGSGATPRGGKDVYLPRGPYALIRSQNVFNDGFRHDGLAYIGARHALELTGVAVLDRDVLLNITGDSVARACQVDPHILPARVNQHVAIIRSDPTAIDPDFLRYFLVCPEMQAKLLSWAGSGGTRNALTKAMIEAFDVQAPEDVSEQRVIAHILGTLDDKIELNRRMNETLEGMARALFKSWFVDFDPVRAKMEGRDTDLPQDITDLFPDRLIDSELGEIPKGWAHDSIYRFTDIVYGAPFTSNQFNTDNGGIPLIRIRDLATHNPSVSTRQVHNKGHLINPGDIVVGMDGTFRLEVWKGPTAWLNQRVCHFEPRSGIPTSFLVGALEEPLAFFERGKVGTTVIYLGKADLDTIRFLQPGQEILDTFAKTAEPLLEKAVANSREARTLAALRDTLLPKLISGEIRVRNAARALESAT